MSERRNTRNDRLLYGVQTLVEFESKYASAEHGDSYHSPAEGYAVIREEVLEVSENIGSIKSSLRLMDQRVRLKYGMEPVKESAAYIRNLAITAAIEAIHVAAAAAKMEHSIDIGATRYFEEPKSEEDRTE